MAAPTTLRAIAAQRDALQEIEADVLEMVRAAQGVIYAYEPEGVDQPPAELRRLARACQRLTGTDYQL